jgi:hypothetical protein
MVFHFQSGALRVTRSQSGENTAMLPLGYAAARRRHDALFQGSPIGLATHGIDRVTSIIRHWFSWFNFRATPATTKKARKET